jgi:hypothetical protein
VNETTRPISTNLTKTVPKDTSNEVRSTEEQVIYKLKQAVNPQPIH